MINQVLVGGGEMGALMRAFDWSQTPLGPVETWPQSLRSAVSILLPSKAQITLFWGREFTVLYNDAYRPVLATKHPRVLGVSGQECWYEIWDFLEPLLQGVVDTGEAYWARDLQFLLFRSGFTEETYFDVSYDPVRDETGNVGGVFCIVAETTGRVLSERRLRTLRELGTRTIEGQTGEAVCAIAAETLAAVPEDTPFALFYLLDEAQATARLVCSTGVAAGTPLSPETVALDEAAPTVWPLAEALASRQPLLVQDFQRRFGDWQLGVWPEPIQKAFVLPMMSSGHERGVGFLIAGLSPRLHFNVEYEGFFMLAAKHVETAIANAHAREAALRRAEALAELDRAKTVFFNNVSHEFRTPLTLILGPLEDLLAHPAGLSSAQHDRLEMMYRNGLRLLKLVNSLLDFSRMEAGRIDISFVPVDLAAMTANLASMFRSAIENAGLRYIVDCPPLPEPVYVDQEMWEKIVLNLLSNAFKFTFAGEIEIALRPVANRVELTVRDTGVGIPDDEREKIFTRFHRVRDSRSRTFEGSGIGLALVQDLVHQHKGDISVESEVDHGTTFTVSIPLGMAHLPQERIGAQRTLVSTSVGAIAYVEEALRWLPRSIPEIGSSAANGTGRRSRPEDARTASLDGRSARIVIVDDNADMRDYLVGLLESQFQTEAYPDGLSALTAVRHNPPDLILCDVMMPELDGFGVLRALRDDAKLSLIPFIMISARAGEEPTVEGLEAGANDYLVKPFSAPELLARINTQLEIVRLREQLLFQAVDLAKTDERQQLARDLHDSVNQTLFSASIIAQALPTTWKRDPEKVLPYLSKLDQLTRSAMAEMRTLLYQLRPSGMENVRLGDLLTLLVAAFRGRSIIEIDLHIKQENEDAPPNLPFDVRYNFYRIAQETLNNIVKHSSADHVEINFEETPHMTTLRIHDDGRGFDTGSVTAGMGLNNMRERAEGVGATFRITSQSGRGTEIIIHRDTPPGETASS